MIVLKANPRNNQCDSQLISPNKFYYYLEHLPVDCVSYISTSTQNKNIYCAVISFNYERPKRPAKLNQKIQNRKKLFQLNIIELNIYSDYYIS